MNLRKFIYTTLICIVSLFTRNTFARGGDDSSLRDPLTNINYREAFDQTKIQAKYASLMHELGCGENVFGQSAKQAETLIPSTQELEKYQKACLKKLQSARNWALTEDTREAATMVLLLFCGATATQFALKKMYQSEEDGKKEAVNSSSFGFMVAFMNAAWYLKPAIRSFYNYLVPPEHPLNQLEERFATQQCFIPKNLWSIIREKFMVARSNSFEQRASMDFLEFALGLTTYNTTKLEISSDQVELGIQEIFRKIDTFFSDYNEPSHNCNLCTAEQSEKTRWLLKDNVAKFIYSLTGQQTDAPRYVQLHGIGGIGKTYFVNQLCEWIKDFFPESVRSEQIIITSADELEGNKDKPGAFLRVLRNQSMTNKQGSIIFMDEATWLNDDSMISSAKRVFNGDQSKLSTSFFGGGVDGSGINLKIPPMLIFVASNDEIKDPALKTRFDTIEFPTPKKEKLVNFAKKLVAENKMLQNNGINIDSFDFDAWVTETGINNFRDVASNVVAAILS